MTHKISSSANMMKIDLLQAEQNKTYIFIPMRNLFTNNNTYFNTDNDIYKKKMYKEVNIQKKK